MGKKVHKWVKITDGKSQCTLCGCIKSNTKLTATIYIKEEKLTFKEPECER